MRKEYQNQDELFFLATDAVVIRCKQPYKIQEEIIETENFVPEAFVIHHFQKENSGALNSTGEPMSQGELLLRQFEFQPEMIAGSNSDSSPSKGLYKLENGGDDDEEDWDEEDDDWDEDEEDEEDWEDDEEEWDEDDEDWDEDEEEDEDWDEDAEKE